MNPAVNSARKTLPMPIKVEAMNWRPCTRGTLRGVTDLYFPDSAFTMLGAHYHVQHGSAWVTTPAVPLIDKDGFPIRDDRKKIVHKPLFNVEAKRCEEFRIACVTAIEKVIGGRPA